MVFRRTYAGHENLSHAEVDSLDRSNPSFMYPTNTFEDTMLAVLNKLGIAGGNVLLLHKIAPMLKDAMILFLALIISAGSKTLLLLRKPLSFKACILYFDRSTSAMTTNAIRFKTTYHPVIKNVQRLSYFSVIYFAMKKILLLATVLCIVFTTHASIANPYRRQV